LLRKDRIGVAMIEAMEARGPDQAGHDHHRADQRQHRHRPGLRGAAKGLKLILVMPESMSIERRKMLILLGARLELTPAERGMAGAVARARELLARSRAR
jgi:cysteine synthase A